MEQTVQRMLLTGSVSAGSVGSTITAPSATAAPSNDFASPSKNSTNYMSYDKSVMHEFSTRCKGILGMTPESLFRAADVEQKGQISDQQFKSFL